MKRILIIALNVFLLTGMIFLLGFAEYSHEQLSCKDVKLTLHIDGADTLLTYEEVAGAIEKVNGKLKGREVSGISIEKVNSSVLAIPYVETCESHLTVNNVLYIDVRQRTPLFKVITTGNKWFVVDVKGYIMPYPDKHILNLPVAGGMAGDEFMLFQGTGVSGFLLGKTSAMPSLYRIMTELNRDDLLKQLIDAVFVTETSEFEFFPKVGSQKIILGDTNHLRMKLENLKSFYKEVVPKTGLDYYNSVDLRFINQVVCNK